MSWLFDLNTICVFYTHCRDFVQTLMSQLMNILAGYYLLNGLFLWCHEWLSICSAIVIHLVFPHCPWNNLAHFLTKWCYFQLFAKRMSLLFDNNLLTILCLSFEHLLFLLTEDNSQCIFVHFWCHTSSAAVIRHDKCMFHTDTIGRFQII